MSKYVVASSKDWFARHEKSGAFESLDVVWINSKEELTLAALEGINPRYVFFPHWNWIVPPEIFEKFECVVFHTAPLPFGRGGSPIQNLIARKIYTAPVCALRMTETLDGGPVYDREEVSLEGSISEIFARIARAVENLILKIVKDEPQPQPQTGEPVYFQRRTEADSEVLPDTDLRSFYDSIRMVDGQGYPRAFIKYGKFKLEFSDAEYGDGVLSAKVTVRKNEDP